MRRKRPTAKASGKTGKVRSYAEFEARYFPALHKQKQTEMDRRQSAKQGTGIIGELMESAIRAAMRTN